MTGTYNQFLTVMGSTVTLCGQGQHPKLAGYAQISFWCAILRNLEDG